MLFVGVDQMANIDYFITTDLLLFSGYEWNNAKNRACRSFQWLRSTRGVVRVIMVRSSFYATLNDRCVGKQHRDGCRASFSKLLDRHNTHHISLWCKTRVHHHWHICAVNNINRGSLFTQKPQCFTLWFCNFASPWHRYSEKRGSKRVVRKGGLNLRPERL